MPAKGDPHPRPCPERERRPQHEKGERGLDFSQELEYFLLHRRWDSPAPLEPRDRPVATSRTLPRGDGEEAGSVRQSQGVKKHSASQ